MLDKYILENKIIVSDSDKLSNLFLDETDYINFAEIVAKTLIDKNLKLSIAESLTGGLVSSKLVDIAGVSECFFEGIISYSNFSKINRLKVKPETLNEYGVVSLQTAIEMAKGLLLNNNTDIAISTTGIAGPTGETLNKPIGLVCFGLATKSEYYCVKQIFTGNRLEIKEKSANFALFYLNKFLNNQL